MRKFNLNWGVMLAAVVLLGYTYISFLGLLYKVDGVIWKAVLFAIAIIVLVATCVYIMVNSKMTKSKEVGIVGQIIFGVIILATFLLSGGPFTSFLKVAGSKDAIETEIVNVKDAVSGLDVEYNTYAANRVSEYRTSMLERNELKVQSLQRRLNPDSIATMQQLRQNWVADIGDMSIWNIRLPQNLKYMQQCVSEWTDNYVQLSDFVYDSEKNQSFKYEKFDSSLNKLMDSFKNAGYSLWAVIVAILSALVMMIPYWLAIPTQTRNTKGITYVKQIKH